MGKKELTYEQQKELAKSYLMRFITPEGYPKGQNNTYLVKVKRNPKTNRIVRIICRYTYDGLLETYCQHFSFYYFNNETIKITSKNKLSHHYKHLQFVELDFKKEKDREMITMLHSLQTFGNDLNTIIRHELGL